MDRGLYVAASGALSQQKVLDTATLNLSQASVAGFKKDFPVFRTIDAEQGYKLSSPINALSYNSEKAFVEAGSLQTDYTQGDLRKTGNELHFALFGEGFMVVEKTNAETGLSETFYTRNGRFVLNADGELTTMRGDRVMGEAGPIVLDGPDIDVDSSGNIQQNGAIAGKLKVVTFPKPYPINRAGGGLYKADKGVNPTAAEGVKVLNEHVELSNAKAIEEMVKMITALRSYETNMKLIKGFDTITESAISLAK